VTVPCSMQVAIVGIAGCAVGVLSVLYGQALIGWICRHLPEDLGGLHIQQRVAPDLQLSDWLEPGAYGWREGEDGQPVPVDYER